MFGLEKIKNDIREIKISQNEIFVKLENMREDLHEINEKLCDPDCPENETIKVIKELGERLKDYNEIMAQMLGMANEVRKVKQEDEEIRNSDKKKKKK